MKILTLPLILIGFSAGLFASENDFSVVATTNALHIASVNEMEEEAPWYTFQQAFCTSFVENLPSIGGRVMPVKVHVRDSMEAAEALRNGTCEAVMVMGEMLPISLRHKNFISVKAVAKFGTPVRVFHFVMRKDDPALVSTLMPAFERATSSSTFQKTVGRASGTHAMASK